MPRIKKFEPEALLECLKNCAVFDENNKILSRSHKVWNEAASKLSITISADALNFYVRENRWNLRSKLAEYFAIEITKDDSPDLSLNTTTATNEDEEFAPVSYTNCFSKSPPLIFDISLNEEEWNRIKPVQKNYGENRANGKTYNVLQSGWTDVISRACFDKSQLPCSFTFKHAKICEASESKAYLTIRGVCKECGAHFNGFS